MGVDKASQCQLLSLYCPSIENRVIKSTRLRWEGHLVKMEDGRKAFKILIGMPTGKRALGKPRKDRKILLE